MKLDTRAFTEVQLPFAAVHKFAGLLAELDAPNEVYLNRTNGHLYFIPPSAGSNGTVSLLENVVVVTSASNITLRGMTLSHARGIGLRAEGAVERIACC